MTVPSVSIGPFVTGEKPLILTYQYLDSTGVPLDLTGFAVQFQVREHDATSALVRSGYLESAPNGQVSYIWQGDEFLTPGKYSAQFWVGNGAQRFASDLITFTVQSSLDTPPNL